MDSDEFSDPEAEVNETRAKPGGGSESRASSAFVAAFGNLKKSEFYKAPEPLPSSSAHPGATRAPAPGGSEPGAPKAATGRTNCVLVSHKQRGNPLLKSICNVPWEYSEIVPDYVMGKTTCALFLSLRYHNLNPDYINERLKLLGRQYELRVLLVQVDVKEPNHALKNLTRICILADLTMMLAWSAEEAGRIVETYKIYENKPPDLIMERPNSSPHQQLVSALTSVRSVNKTDAATLLSTFGSLERVIRASPDALGLCPGLGAQKAGRLHRVLHQPFVRHRAAAAASRRGARE
ncbi:DNA excision repair protein ERCC-1 [Bacillus rossius redtenbacheri]|uniref:DNA excision repair protein ERCC-1 n=1 Tax=Bacillus rossius redtenbacheri TaxID=93214 RepID=UPI002FDCB6BB